MPLQSRVKRSRRNNRLFHNCENTVDEFARVTIVAASCTHHQWIAAIKKAPIPDPRNHCGETNEGQPPGRTIQN
jgi:hypothetical protein